MYSKIQEKVLEHQNDLIAFTQKLIQIPSYTGCEKEASLLVQNEMKKLGYDEVSMDAYGSILGRIGCGNIQILMDAHIDVVRADDGDKWKHDPFSGIIEEGLLWGRGSADTKSSAAAMLYAGIILKEANLVKDKSIYISLSVMEEDIDGEMLARVIESAGLKPEYAIIGEPSSMKLATGHRGRSMYMITTEGRSAHGSTPEKGENAIYKMAEIISRVERLQEELSRKKGEHGSVTLSHIEDRTASLNAVPDQCTVYLDRRLAVGEDENIVAEEMNELVKGTDAKWAIYDAKATCWTGEEVTLHTFLPAWETDKDSRLVSTGMSVYKKLFDQEALLCKWLFSTNGFATAGKYQIPTIGLGPGDPLMAHMRDEHCPVSNITDACAFYAALAADL